MFTVSIFKDTNRVVANSNVNWSGIKRGSYIKFKNIPALFTIYEAHNLLIFKDFEIVNSRTIKINQDVGIDIQKHDELKIIYKEYELISIFGISNSGKGYRKGDKIKLDNEYPSVDISTGITNYTTLEVTDTDKYGGITSVSIISKGRYLVKPQTNILGCIGGTGSGALFESLFTEVSVQKPLERRIEFIENNVPCIIYLDSPLPVGITEGKISLSKWDILINQPINNTLINSEFDIIQDFTQYLHLPLLAQNSLSRDVLLNQSLNILDDEINKLKEAVANINKHLNIS